MDKAGIGGACASICGVDRDSRYLPLQAANVPHFALKVPTTKCLVGLIGLFGMEKN